MDLPAHLVVHDVVHAINVIPGRRGVDHIAIGPYFQLLLPTNALLDIKTWTTRKPNRE